VPDAPPRLGFQVATWLRETGLEPLSIETLPVSECRLGAPAAGFWDVRERAVAHTLDTVADDEEADARALAEAVRAYRAEAEQLGEAFVEVQHALLVATLAQRPIDVEAFESAREAVRREGA